MRHQILLAIFLVFSLIGGVRINSLDTHDDLFFMHVNVLNEGAKDLDDLKVRVVIYDLGIFLQTNPFDLEEGEVDGKFLFWNIPKSIEKGEYLARITVSNDDVREVRHRLVTI
jgi:hypothetical protein